MRGTAVAWAVLRPCLIRPATAWREHLVRHLCVLAGAWPCPRGGSALGLSGPIWSGHKKHARPGSQSFGYPLAAAAVGERLWAGQAWTWQLAYHPFPTPPFGLQ